MAAHNWKRTCWVWHFCWGRRWVHPWLAPLPRLPLVMQFIHIPAVMKCVFGIFDLINVHLIHCILHWKYVEGKKNTCSTWPSSWKTQHFFYGLLGLLQFYSGSDWSNVPAEGDQSQEEALDGDGADGEETPADSPGVSGESVFSTVVCHQCGFLCCYCWF